MALVYMKTVLDKAYKDGYAVGAFNVINMEFLEAIIAGARQSASPVILNIAEVHLPYVNLDNIVPAIKAIANRERFDIVLNLDHGLTIPTIEKAISLGFTSIMFDGSHLDFDENIHQTREVVKMCRPWNITVEAEFGKADPAKYTDINQAKQFVNETGIDALAVAIGNSHGKYKGEPDLDFERLKAIRDVTGIPLVLHGGSGISEADFRKAISLGIAKINFFTGMSEAAMKATADYMNTAGQRYNDYPLMMNRVREQVALVVSGQMDIFGSRGKAADELPHA